MQWCHVRRQLDSFDIWHTLFQTIIVPLEPFGFFSQAKKYFIFFKICFSMTLKKKKKSQKRFWVIKDGRETPTGFYAQHDGVTFFGPRFEEVAEEVQVYPQICCVDVTNISPSSIVQVLGCAACIRCDFLRKLATGWILVFKCVPKDTFHSADAGFLFGGVFRLSPECLLMFLPCMETCFYSTVVSLLYQIKGRNMVQLSNIMIYTVWDKYGSSVAALIL